MSLVGLMAGPERAWGQAVNIDASQAAPPRTDTGTGMCMNAVHLGKVMTGTTYFSTNAAGINEAIRLLESKTQDSAVTAVALQQRYPVINFRNVSNGSVGDFTTDSWFPFTTLGNPNGNDRYFATRTRAYLKVPAAGIYTYAMRGGEMAHLTIAGTGVMDNKKGVTTKQVQFAAPGLYALEIVHFQNDGDAILELSRADRGLLEGTFLTPLNTTDYKLWTAEDLFSAVAGEGNCQECAANAPCPMANYCRDSLCQPCILNDHCGPQCQACSKERPICVTPDQRGETAHCVGCTKGTDCSSGKCDISSGNCEPPPPMVCDPACQAQQGYNTGGMAACDLTRQRPANGARPGGLAGAALVLLISLRRWRRTYRHP